MNRHVDADQRAFGEPHEVDVDRDILHRIELIVARDHPVLLAVDLDVVQRRQEVAGIDFVADVDVIDSDGERGFVGSVDHGRGTALATNCPGGPLAGLRAQRRLDFLHGGHALKSYELQSDCMKTAAASLQGCGGHGRAGL